MTRLRKGDPHPEGRRCPACGAVVRLHAHAVAPRRGRPRGGVELWVCPAQTAEGDAQHAPGVRLYAPHELRPAPDREG